MVRLAQEQETDSVEQALTVLRIESRGWFHSYEGYELEQVILHHVADETDLVKVSSTTLDSDVFLEGDRDRGNVVPVPTEDPHDKQSRGSRFTQPRDTCATCSAELSKVDERLRGAAKRTTAAQT